MLDKVERQRLESGIRQMLRENPYVFDQTMADQLNTTLGRVKYLRTSMNLYKRPRQSEWESYEDEFILDALHELAEKLDRSALAVASRMRALTAHHKNRKRKTGETS